MALTSSIPVLVAIPAANVDLARRLFGELGQGSGAFPVSVSPIANPSAPPLWYIALYNVKAGSRTFDLLRDAKQGTPPDLGQFGEGTTQAEVDTVFGALRIINPPISNGQADVSIPDGEGGTVDASARQWALYQLSEIGAGLTITQEPEPPVTVWTLDQETIRTRLNGSSLTNPQKLAAANALFPDGDWP